MHRIIIALAFVMLALSGCGAASVATPITTTTPTATVIPPTATSAVTPIPLPTPEPTSTPVTAASATNDFAPKQRSIWNTTVGQDQMSGACAKGSVLPAYGLVQITPNDKGAGFDWKNQEPKPYAMTRKTANEYVYAGPNSINDGVVTMTVTFADDKNLTLVRQFTSKADPACLHTHEYAGVFQWFR